MLDNNTIDILRKKFSESYFFVRIFNHNGATYIWNDKTIYIKLRDNKIKNVDIFVQSTIKVFKESIERKYANMKSRLLSVIIPNYNNELTIKNTIDSILNSTYKDIEIIIIDDCSTDKSVELIKNFYGKNPLIKLYVNNKNEGTFYGRNKGVLMSNGYYIANVDGDDTIHPDKFTFEITELEKENKMSWQAFKATRVLHLTKIPVLSRLNLPIGGGVNIINATGENHGPSWRMIVHLTDEIEAYGLYPGGQSGNPGSPYYDSFVDYWAAGKYYRLLFLPKEKLKQHERTKWHIQFKKAVA